MTILFSLPKAVNIPNMEIKEFLTQIVPSESKSLQKVIYDYYSNTINNDTAKESIDLKITDKQKSLIHIDKGWVFKKSIDNYLTQQNKYLVYKAGQSLLINPQNFLINYTFKDPNLTYVDIHFKAFENDKDWTWFFSKNYLNFQNILRIYISFEKGQGIKIGKFIKTLNEVLKIKQIPYQLKIENQLSNRNENAVLYFQRENYFLVFFIIRYLHLKFDVSRSIFRNASPLFTYKTSLKGISFAEDPNESGVSFGEKRSKILAELYNLGKSDPDFIEKELKKRGYDWQEFYRNPFEKYPYCFKIFSANDDLFLESSLLEGRYDDKYFPKINLAMDISKIILKNAIFSTIKNKMRVDWLKGLPDIYYPNNTLYKICNDEEKLEIIDFLSQLYQLSVNDGLLKITCKVCLGCIDKTKLSSSNSKLYDQIAARIGEKMGSPLTVIQDLAINEKYTERIELIKKDFEKRGVVTWLPDDAFNPTISGFGYSFIGIKILEGVRKP